MALFRRGGGARRPPPPEQETVERLGAPAFRELTERLQERPPARRLEILDLAAASGNHLAHFAFLRCRFHVGDLEESLPEWRRDDEAPPPDPARLLPLQPDLALDLVLAWNLLDYLDDDALLRLGRHLADRCAPGARLHAFVQTRAEMPARPGRFLLGEGGEVTWHHRNTPVTAAPRRPRHLLERALPGFRVERARLLQNGLQEYLFRTGEG